MTGPLTKTIPSGVVTIHPWRRRATTEGRNEIGAPQRSFFAQGHRIFGQATYGLEYFNFGKTRITLSANAQTGGYFSYVIGKENYLFTDDGGFAHNELFYVPNNINEIPLAAVTVDDVTYTPEEQWAILDDFIEDDPHLRDRRGNYVQRNGGKEPFEITADLKVSQDFFINTAKGKRNTLQLTLEVFNFTNLINKDWGRVRNVGRYGNYRIVELRNSTLGNTTLPVYNIAEDLIRGDKPWEGDQNLDINGFRSSRWVMQFGIRYIFE